jgi:hypothetical protein
MAPMRCFAFVLASLPSGMHASDVTTNNTHGFALGLRPEFERLLGKEAVDDFIASAWKRSVTEVDVDSQYNSTASRKTAPMSKPEGNFEFGHQRFDALGPALKSSVNFFSVWRGR